MNVIRTRSPFFVEVNEPTQTKARFKIYVWYLGDTEPTTPVYILEKPIVSTTNRALYINISPYIEGFLNPNTPNNSPSDPTVCWDFKQVANVKVETQFYNGSTWSSNTTYNYVAVDGFTPYGVNLLWDGGSPFGAVLKVIPLINDNSFRYSNLGGLVYGFNVLIEHDGVSETRVIYNGTITKTILDDTSPEGIYNMIVPFDSYFASDPKTTILIESDLTTDIYNYTFERFCEPKYTPEFILYINRYGGWDYIPFMKVRRDSVQAKSDTYQLNQVFTDPAFGYDQLIGQSKIFNSELRKTIKLSTGWVDESMKTQIEDLLVSKRVLLYSESDVIVKTQSVDIQTKINEKLINYTIDFEINHNLVNDQQ
jgi:hypothetical protein